MSNPTATARFRNEVTSDVPRPARVPPHLSTRPDVADVVTKGKQASRAELPAVDPGAPGVRVTTLLGHAEWMERYGRPQDQPVAQFIREHQERIEGWLRDGRRTLGAVRTTADTEDLLQVALLAVLEAVRSGGDLKHVKNQLQNAARRQKAWASRRAVPGSATSEGRVLSEYLGSGAVAVRDVAAGTAKRRAA